jgi:hypothetical protein
VFGVNASTASAIAIGRLWPHLPGAVKARPRVPRKLVA